MKKLFLIYLLLFIISSSGFADIKNSNYTEDAAKQIELKNFDKISSELILFINKPDIDREIKFPNTIAVTVHCSITINGETYDSYGSGNNVKRATRRCIRSLMRFL